MVRRSNSYGKWSAITSAARISIAQNKRETLSLMRKNQGLTSESDCAVKAFYREKARANSFLQEVHEHRKKSRILQPKWDENGNVLVEKEVVKNEKKLQRLRLPSLDNDQEEKSREQVHEVGGGPLFKLNNGKMESSKEISGGNKLKNGTIKQLQKSRNEFREAWVLNERNSEDKLEKKTPPAELKKGFVENEENKGSSKEGTGVDKLETSSPGTKKETNVPPTKRPFKIRSRATSICISCQHFHCQNLPSVNGPKIERKWSDELRLNDRCESSKKDSRKLSLPMIRPMSDVTDLKIRRMSDVTDLKMRSVYMS